MTPNIRTGELIEELRRLEEETFEVLDLVDSGDELASTSSSTSCCSTSIFT